MRKGNHSGSGKGSYFVIFREPAGMVHPTESMFNPPTFRENLPLIRLDSFGKVRHTIQKYEKGDIAVPVPTLNEVSIGKNMYEVELETDQVKVFRQIGEEEYLQWYVGNENVSRRGEIRRLFLMEIPLAAAAGIVVEAVLFPI